MATVADPSTAGGPRSAETAPRAAEAPAVRSQALITVVALAVAAGVIHAVAMVDHFDHYWLYGVFFLVVTYAQILWGIWIYRRPHDRRALVAGVVGSLVIVAVWIVSRTVGAPLGPEQWDAERIGAMDIMATLDQLVAAALVIVLIAPAGRVGRRLHWLAGGHAVRVGIMLCTASVFALLLGSHSH